MHKPYILAHDTGTGGDKAVLTDLRGRIVDSAYQAYGLNYPRPDWAEQDPDELWNAVAHTTRLVLEKTGVKGMIGKGDRSPEVIAAMKKECAVYFAAIGGAGALLSTFIKKSEIVCYEDLGAEAVYRLTVEKFPVIVAIDCEGNDLYIDGPVKWVNELKR